MLSPLASWSGYAAVGQTFADWLMPVLVLMGGLAIGLGLLGFVVSRLGSARNVSGVSGDGTVRGGTVSAHKLGLPGGSILPAKLTAAASQPIWDKAAEVHALRHADDPEPEVSRADRYADVHTGYTRG